MSHQLRVAKRAQSVRIFMTDGTVLSATIFIPWATDGPLSGRSVAEAVEESAPALPCEDDEGRFMVVGAAAISAVAVAAADTSDEGFFHRRPGRVRLRGGHELDGFLRHYLGMGDRWSDALRLSDDWIQMEVGDDVIWFRVDDLVYAREAAAAVESGAHAV